MGIWGSSSFPRVEDLLLTGVAEPGWGPLLGLGMSGHLGISAHWEHRACCHLPPAHPDAAPRSRPEGERC